jgi:hypothetical protein
MAMYMSLVINKKWKDGTVLELDYQAKMIHLPNISLVKHEDLGIEINPNYVSFIKEVIQQD